jgi:hypothetical protein
VRSVGGNALCAMTSGCVTSWNGGRVVSRSNKDLILFTEICLRVTHKKA